MSNRFTVSSTPLEGLMLVERKRLGDSRGFLQRLFCATELAEAGWYKPIEQINHTFTAKLGTVRGMHYQLPPHAEMKLVSCLHGEVLDVAVDLRADSPTFLKWHAQRLSDANGAALLIPEGFAHGFQALTDNVEMFYCHSAAYCSDAERGLHPLDENLGISWPLEIAELSARDQNHPRLDGKFEGVRL